MLLKYRNAQMIVDNANKDMFIRIQSLIPEPQIDDLWFMPSKNTPCSRAVVYSRLSLLSFDLLERTLKILNYEEGKDQ